MTKKKSKPQDEDDDPARERFREWCRQEIEQDPRFAHAIITDMLALYAASGGLRERDDAVYLLTDLGRRVAEERRRFKHQVGARNSAQTRRERAAKWQGKIEKEAKRLVLDKRRSVRNIAALLAPKTATDPADPATAKTVDAVRTYVGNLRRAARLKKSG